MNFETELAKLVVASLLSSVLIVAIGSYLHYWIVANNPKAHVNAWVGLLSRQIADAGVAEHIGPHVEFVRRRIHPVAARFGDLFDRTWLRTDAADLEENIRTGIAVVRQRTSAYIETAFGGVECPQERRTSPILKRYPE